MSDSTREVEHLIVGGGIGGLATALALSRRGLSVHVLEQAPEFAEIGAGLQLAPNALWVLDQLGLLDAALIDAVRPPQAALMSAVTGRPVTALDFGESFVATYGYPYVVTHRSDLLDAILGACRADPAITLEVSKQVVAVRDESDHVVVECRDGSRYATGALIGADGVWSAVRKHTVGDEDAAYIGDVAYRGTLPRSAVSSRIARAGLTWWVGPGIHLIQYPVRGGELLNQVAVFTARRDGPPGEWGPPSELDAAFRDAIDPVRETIQQINRDRRWVLRDRPPAPSWTKGRTTLVGDAAHPMAQYLAQGACQALEDAFVLAGCLAEQRSQPSAAFAAYEAERCERTARVQTWARRMGDIVHADGMTALLRDELLRTRAANDFGYVDWLYGYRAPGRAAAPVLAS